MSRPIPILYVHYGDEWIRGSERLLLDLLAHIDRNRFAPVVWCNGEQMENAVRELNLPVYRSRFDILLTSIRPNHRVGCWARQIREGLHIAARHRIRVIHSNSGGPVQWMLPVARLRRIPILAHLHAPYLKRDRYAFGIRFADRAVGVSKYVLRGLQADGVSAKKLARPQSIAARTHQASPHGLDPVRLTRQSLPLPQS
jgi:L-malate glycosyltransferase